MTTAEKQSQESVANGNGRQKKQVSAKERYDQSLAVYSNPSLPTDMRLRGAATLFEMKREDIQKALPSSVSAERVISTFLREMKKTPKLSECTFESLFVSMMEAASLNLKTDGVLGHAYLIPYRNNRKIDGKWVTSYEAQLQIGYRGYLDLARREEKIIIKTRCVYAGDIFEYVEGDDDYIKHVPLQDRDEAPTEAQVTHVYLIAKDLEGHVICRNVWARAQIDRHKQKYSKAWEKDDSPWNTSWETMARKTLIRDSIARGELPVCAEAQEMAVREETFEAKHLPQAQPQRHTLSYQQLQERILSGPGKDADGESDFDSQDDPGVETENADKSISPLSDEELADTTPESQSENADETDSGKDTVPAHNAYMIGANENPISWEKVVREKIKNCQTPEQLLAIEKGIMLSYKQKAIAKTTHEKLIQLVQKSLDDKLG